MFKRLARKLGYSIAVLVAVISLITGIVFVSPVDPSLLTFGQMADAESLEQKRKALKLDQPLWVQVLAYLNDISPLSVHPEKGTDWRQYKHLKLLQTGHNVFVIKWPYLRESYQSGRPVADILARAVPQTVVLSLVAMIFALFLGIGLGIWAALRDKTWLGQTILSLSVLGVSVPSYVAGILLAYLFGVALWPYTGLDYTGSLIDYNDLGEQRWYWSHLWLPALALGIRPVAIITQLTRSALLDVMQQEYIRTARAKGLNPRQVMLRHALRNAMNPVVTAASGWFASLLAGAVFVEYVFDYKGIGSALIDHLLLYDVPVVLGISLFIALVFVTINLLVDLLYTWLDPRAAT